MALFVMLMLCSIVKQAQFTPTINRSNKTIDELSKHRSWSFNGKDSPHFCVFVSDWKGSFGNLQLYLPIIKIKHKLNPLLHQIGKREKTFWQTKSCNNSAFISQVSEEISGPDLRRHLRQSSSDSLRLHLQQTIFTKFQLWEVKKPCSV